MPCLVLALQVLIGTALDALVPTQVPNDSWSAYIFTSRNLKTVTLWGTSLLCATLAWLGGLLFLYVLLSRYFLPATAHHSRSLYFDYTKADAVATAHFLPDVQYHKASLSEVSRSTHLPHLPRQSVVTLRYSQISFNNPKYGNIRFP